MTSSLENKQAYRLNYSNSDQPPEHGYLALFVFLKKQSVLHPVQMRFTPISQKHEYEALTLIL